MRILFVLPSLSFGGAERVMLTLLKHLDRDRFSPELAVGAGGGHYADSVPDDVPVHVLGSGRARSAIPALVRLVRRQRYDVVFSTLGYLNMLVMLARPFMPRSTAFIGRETNIPSLHLARSAYPRLLPFLYRRLYRHFDHVVCQSMDMRLDLSRNFGLPDTKSRIIHNPVDVERIEALAALNGANLPEGRVNLVAAGKLMPQKGFDLLLHALSQANDPDLHLTILGEGAERPRLEALARELGLNAQVAMPGYVDNPYSVMAAADLFVLSSRFEGFPNVVLEAQACGTPVLAFACPGGLGEIIQDGRNGWLVHAENVGALARALRARVTEGLDPETIRATVRDRYLAQAITAQYEQLFDDVASARTGQAPKERA